VYVFACRLKAGRQAAPDDRDPGSYNLTLEVLMDSKGRLILFVLLVVAALTWNLHVTRVF
jgi:hypothetical protein